MERDAARGHRSPCSRILGIETERAIALRLTGVETPAAILSVAAGAISQPLPAVPAAPAARASIDLAKLAGRLPVLLVAEAELGQLANPGALVRVEAKAVAGFRQHLAQSLGIAASSPVPLEGGDTARVVVFRDSVGGNPTAIIVGEPDFSEPVLVRLHSACLTGDVFGCRRCDCGEQLKLATARVTQARGIVLYLEQEGRGLGLVNKMRLQDMGLDTVAANLALGFEDDERDYRTAARMLQLLGCSRVVLLTNNPAKLEGLSSAGVEICGSIPLHAPIKT
jgi:GTP cyclohydrolase II